MTRTAKRGGLVNVAPKSGGGAVSVAIPENLVGLEGLSTKQAARLIGGSPKTLENWRWRGIGPSYRKCGKRISYSVASLRAYLAENTVQPRG